MRLFKEQLCIYVNFGQKDACIHGFWQKPCVYTQLLAKNKHMYVTFSPKTCVYREDSGKK